MPSSVSSLICEASSTATVGDGSGRLNLFQPPGARFWMACPRRTFQNRNRNAICPKPETQDAVFMSLPVRRKADKQRSVEIALRAVANYGGGVLSRIAGNLLLALASTILTLAVLEGAFRLRGDAPLASGWRSLCPTAQMNEFGYRGRRVSYSDDDYVIVLLGDSQLEACGLPDDQMPEILLEKSLGALGRKTRVIGLGASGYAQDQELLALEEYFQKYRADLVVIWLTPGNDVWNNTFRTHTVSRADGPPKPTFWLDNHVLKGPTERIGERTSSLYLLQLLRNALGGFEAAWSRRLPPAEKGAAAIPPEFATTTAATKEAVETQQSHWSMFLTPTPPRSNMASS